MLWIKAFFYRFTEGSTPRTGERIRIHPAIFKGHCLTINNDGDGGAGISYYQPSNMLLDTHVTALYPRIPMTAETMRFIAACITVQREKFGHGYSLNNAHLSVFRMMLPIDDECRPDYAFMEQYIREREKQLVTQYIEHIKLEKISGGDTS